MKDKAKGSFCICFLLEGFESEAVLAGWAKVKDESCLSSLLQLVNRVRGRQINSAQRIIFFMRFMFIIFSIVFLCCLSTV